MNSLMFASPDHWGNELMSTKQREQHQRISWPLSLEGTKSTGGKDGFSMVCLCVVPLLFSVLGFEGRWEVNE